MGVGRGGGTEEQKKEIIGYDGERGVSFFKDQGRGILYLVSRSNLRLAPRARVLILILARDAVPAT